MKLKLSTLAIIIGAIFFAYYVFYNQQKTPTIIYSPLPTPDPVSTPIMHLQQQPDYDNDITPIENFSMVDDQLDTPNYSGNVRPDNVMVVDEPITRL